MKNEENDEDKSKVKVLKKVRRQFLRKAVEEEPPPLLVDPQAHHISGTDVYAINYSVGLVEHKRKICIGPQYLNIHFNVKKSTLASTKQSKTAALDLCINENNPPVSWEYTVKRLESYGDLQFATWAHRIRNHYAKYSKVMSNYYDLLESNSPGFHETYKLTQHEAENACREIESNYSYNKIVQFLKKDANELISSSYSEGFLEKIGHTPDSFLSWSKINGLPKILNTDSPMYEDIIKEFLNCIPMITNAIQEGPESESEIYHREGHKLKITAKCVTILDPTPEGIFYYFYLIIKDIDSSNQTNEAASTEIDLETCNKKSVKCEKDADM